MTEAFCNYINCSTNEKEGEASSEILLLFVFLQKEYSLYKQS